jgi:hypothetical protein
MGRQPHTLSKASLDCNPVWSTTLPCKKQIVLLFDIKDRDSLSSIDNTQEQCFFIHVIYVARGDVIFLNSGSNAYVRGMICHPPSLVATSYDVRSKADLVSFACPHFTVPLQPVIPVPRATSFSTHCFCHSPPSLPLAYFLHSLQLVYSSCLLILTFR